jgi:pyrroline-5-carboxylate reductase
MEAMTYGVIGVGSIATAIVNGLCETAGPAPTILLSPRNAGQAVALAARFPTVHVAPSNQAVIDGAAVLLLCLRPQQADSVLHGLDFSSRPAVISVMAGIPLETLRRLLAPVQDIARAIPLPSVAARDGATPIHPSTTAARTLFDRLGTAIELTDAGAFEAASASTATIAAHFAYLDAISRWLTAHGLSEPAARRHVASTFAGLAATLRSGEPDFATLAREHATPGGINEQFLGLLEQARVFDSVNLGLDRVLDRLEARPSTDAANG